MSDSYKDIEDRIEQCLASIPKGEIPNYSLLSEAWNVPYSRLRRRYLGIASRSTRQPTNRRLNPSQELALKSWINFMDESYVSPTRTMIENCANSILRQAPGVDPENPPRVGEHWTERFLDRHPEYHIRRQRAINIERKRAYNP